MAQRIDIQNPRQGGARLLGLAHAPGERAQNLERLDVMRVVVERAPQILLGALEVTLHQIDLCEFAIRRGAILHRAGGPAQRLLGIHVVAQAARDQTVEVVGVGVVHYEVERPAGILQSLGILGPTIVNRGQASQGPNARGVALDAFEVLVESGPIIARFLGALGRLVEPFQSSVVVVVEIQRALQEPILRIVGVGQ